MIVLGVDPGSQHTGYGILEVEGRKERLVEYGVLHLDVHDDHELRLKTIYDRLTAIVERCLPDECAIEMPVYGHNPQSMLKLGRAQAAAMLAVLNRGIPVTQYTPKEVKKSVTGNGNASKEQVWYMVQAILAIEDAGPNLSLDASDALAVGICHAQRLSHGADKHFKNWESFAKANPGRVG
ncbi:MAG TPA: crossover junction endodeoxyribonuclease RuvC [Rhodothermales bacterium]|nr:crossover junction endodeoxyribonuclease RuvC [Rhodothermales bacterium]